MHLNKKGNANRLLGVQLRDENEFSDEEIAQQVGHNPQQPKTINKTNLV